MSLLKADTIKPVTSSGDLSLQGDSGGSAVDCQNITSAGDINFTGNTDAKIKLPSAGGIYESDGSTAVLTESGGVVTLASSVAGAKGLLQVQSNQDTTASNGSALVTYCFCNITIQKTGSKLLVLATPELHPTTGSTPLNCYLYWKGTTGRSGTIGDYTAISAASWPKVFAGAADGHYTPPLVYLWTHGQDADDVLNLIIYATPGAGTLYGNEGSSTSTMTLMEIV